MSAKVRWLRGAWWVIDHRDGKKWTRRVGASKKLADRIAEQIAARAVLGTDPQVRPRAEKPTPAFEAQAHHFLKVELLDPIRLGLEGAYARNTADYHAGHIRRVLIPYFNQRPVAEIKPADIQDFFDHCRRQSPLRSIATVEKFVATLSLIFANAVQRGLISENPVSAWKRSRPRSRRKSSNGTQRAPNVFTLAEVVRMLEVAREHFPAAYGLLVFLLETGTRLGEASAVTWGQIDLEARTVRIDRSWSNGKYLTTTKSGRARSIRLSDVLQRVLQARRPVDARPEHLVFPSRAGGLLNPSNFRGRVFGPLIERAFGPDRHVTVHGLRHTWATLRLAAGVPLKLLQSEGGWARAELPLNVYAHYLPSEYSAPAGVLPAAVASPSDALTTPMLQATGHDANGFDESRGLS